MAPGRLMCGKPDANARAGDNGRADGLKARVILGPAGGDYGIVLADLFSASGAPASKWATVNRVTSLILAQASIASDTDLPYCRLRDFGVVK